MFIPKSHRFRPEHFDGRYPTRRCHWCASGPHRMGELIHVMEGPMRFRFCKDECLALWQQHRHDSDVVEWLKMGAGTRAEILKGQQCQTSGGGSTTPSKE